MIAASSETVRTHRTCIEAIFSLSVEVLSVDMMPVIFEGPIYDVANLSRHFASAFDGCAVLRSAESSW